MNRQIFDDFDSNGNLDQFFDSGFSSGRSNFVSDFFAKPFESRPLSRQRSPTFQSNNQDSSESMSFNRGNTSARPSDNQSKAQGSAKVHVIPIIVEGREQPLGKRQDTDDIDNQNDVKQGLKSPQTFTRSASPLINDNHSSSGSVQSDRVASSDDRRYNNVVNIPIIVEKSPTSPVQSPKFKNNSDSKLFQNVQGKTSAPGQKASTGFRPQSASFSNLSSNARSSHTIPKSFNAEQKGDVKEPEDLKPPVPPVPEDTLNKPLSAIDQIARIVEEVKVYSEEVDNFCGEKNDKRYRYLDEYLTRSLLKLDQIETEGVQEIRQARKNAITLIESVITKLENVGNTSTPQEAEKTGEPIYEEINNSECQQNATNDEPETPRTDL